LLLCYITDRRQFSGHETARLASLLKKIAEASSRGVDFIQLREKDLPARDLEKLAIEAQHIIRQAGTAQLLINSRTDIAIACEADGVHLPATDISPAEVRQAWETSRNLRLAGPVVSVACHAPAEIDESADIALFAPVFEKHDHAPAGLEALRQACQQKVPVLALGGITLENAQSCLQAGAAGIAAIRLFQQNDIHGVVESLRRITIS
jgi:thiamine-phosphate pyrophosphorylase